MATKPSVSLQPFNEEGYMEVSIHVGDTIPDYYILEASFDDGQTWHTVRFASQVGYAGTTTIIYDYEAYANKPTFYRASSVDSIGQSTWSDPVSATLQVSEWWLKDPLNPSRNVKFMASGNSFDVEEPEDFAEFQPLGRKYEMIVSDVMRGEKLSFNLTTMGRAEHEAFRYLRRTQRVLLIQAPYIKQWYVRLGKSLSEKVLNIESEYRELSVDAIEQGRP